MLDARPRIPLLAAGTIIGAVGFILWRTHHRPAQDGHDVCHECGLSDEDMDAMVANMRAAPGDRASLLAEFHKTFKPGQDPELCRPCAEHILDEAGK